MGRIVDLALYLPKGTSKDYLDENENKKMSRAEMQKKIMQCKALYDFYCHECRVQLTVDKRGYWRVKNKQHDKNCTYGYEYKSFNYERRQGKHSLLEAPKVVPLQIKTSLSKSSSAPETKKPKQYSNTISRLKSKYSSKKRENFYIRTVDEYFYHIKEAKEKGMITELYRVFAREKISYSQKGYPFMYSYQINDTLPEYFFVQGQINNRSNDVEGGIIKFATLKFHDNIEGRYIPKLFFGDPIINAEAQNILNSMKPNEMIGVLVQCKNAYSFESNSTNIHIIELEVYDIDISRYS